MSFNFIRFFPLNFTKAEDFFDMTQEQQKAQFKLLNSYFLQKTHLIWRWHHVLWERRGSL